MFPDCMPDCPLTLMLNVPTDASAAAVNRIVCGVPGASVSVDGVAVTSAGRPESETLTVPLNPLLPVANTEICCPRVPIVSVRVAGERLSE